MQRREFVDQGVGDVEDVVVRRGDEATPGGLKIFEHHHERAVGIVMVGVPDARRAHGKIVAHRRVEPRLGDAETDLPEELPLLVDERLQLDEHRVRQIRRRGQRDTGAPGGARMRIEDLDAADGLAQDLAEPLGRQVLYLRWNRH